jgi:WhiB family redox-sensing transcriptional regulator
MSTVYDIAPRIRKLARDLSRASWMDSGLCLGDPRDLWLERAGETQEAADTRAAHARVVCDACPVRVECLDTAIANREPAGVWGGHTPTERQSLARERRRAGDL